MRLKDQVAIITGGSRGIGLAIAEAYLREGAKVVIASRKQADLDEAAAHLKQQTGGDVLAIPTHTGQEDAVKALIQQTVDTFGKLDIVVNNAATNPHFGPMLTAEASHWDKIFEVNLKGYFFMIKYAAEQMKNGGKIINMASIAGIQPGFMMGVYSCSKAAVIMMTKSLAVELAPDHIRVNAIAPGFIKTKFSAALWTNDQLLEQLEQRTPQQRMADPDEIAGAAVFLASEESSFMTGETVVIDGGLTVSAT